MAGWLARILKDTQTPAFQLDCGSMVSGSLTTTYMAYLVLRLSTGWERFIHVEFDLKTLCF